jgi:hypothetical protein
MTYVSIGIVLGDMRPFFYLEVKAIFLLSVKLWKTNHKP